MFVFGKARLETAAVSGFVVACVYVFVSSVALLFLPDAGRSSPSNLLLAVGVFVIATAVSAVRQVHDAERSERARPERDVTATVIGARPMADVSSGGSPASRGDGSSDARARQDP